MMTKEQYQEKLKLLKNDFDLKKKKLIIEYVIENNPCKIGDIITDHIGSIRFEKLKFSFSLDSDVPESVYYGLELKKDGTPKKNAQIRGIWQSNIGK